jgi:hypothetical protein
MLIERSCLACTLHHEFMNKFLLWGKGEQHFIILPIALNSGKLLRQIATDGFAGYD